MTLAETVQLRQLSKFCILLIFEVRLLQMCSMLKKLRRWITMKLSTLVDNW